jgi:hypothetical protein
MRFYHLEEPNIEIKLIGISTASQLKLKMPHLALGQLGLFTFSIKEKPLLPKVIKMQGF